MRKDLVVGVYFSIAWTQFVNDAPNEIRLGCCRVLIVK